MNHLHSVSLELSNYKGTGSEQNKIIHEVVSTW